jgi:ribose/xylose/arabinose/galactoside ABC-type transport system permease subunit
MDQTQLEVPYELRPLGELRQEFATTAGAIAHSLFRALVPFHPTPALLLPEPSTPQSAASWATVAMLAFALARRRERRAAMYFAMGLLALVPVTGFLASPVRYAEGFLVWPIVGFVAAGQTFVVLIGGIDLSVPWVLNGAAILFVTTSLGRDSRTWWALPLTLGMGLTVGMCNGLAVSFLAVPAVVITLAMNGVAQGLTLGLSKGLTCSSCASYTPKLVTDSVTSSILGVPSGLFLWLGVVLLITFLLSYTTFGYDRLRVRARRERSIMSAGS